MATLTFQILDSFAQDLQIEAETETTREISFVAEDLPSDQDDEVQTRRRLRRGGERKAGGGPQAAKPRLMVIHLFGTTADKTPVRVDVQGFRPFFFVRLPDTRADTRLIFRKRVEAAHPDVDIEFCERKTLIGYTGGARFPFAKLSVQSLAAFRALRNTFLDKETGRPQFALGAGELPLEVFEANLDPMLRFFHLRDLQPCGWVTITADADEPAEDGTLQATCEWEDVSPCAQPPVAVAPFLLASWDIECYSQTGEFPLAKRGYERIAKLLVQKASSAQEATNLLLNAALYPEAPPDGMDPIRRRDGKGVERKHIEPVLANATLQANISEALDAKDPKLMLTALRPLERALPLAGDPVIQIGVVLHRGGAAPTTDKHVFVLGSCDPVEGATVHAYKTERAMLLGWAKAMRAWNPDILLGYNVFGFDERYVWDRAIELGLVHEDTTERGYSTTECEDDLHAFSRLSDRGKEFMLETKFLSSSALGDNTMYIWTAHGRLQVDLYHYVKRSFALASYKLDDVCQHFMSGKLSSVECPVGGTTWTLKTKTTSDVIPGRYVVLLDETGDGLVDKLKVVEVQKGAAVIVEAPNGDDAGDLAIAAASAVKWAVVKDDVPPQEIFRLHRGSAADRARVAAYCIQDCVLVFDLYKKLDVFNNAMAMANACSVPVSYIFTRGQGIKIESLIFKECYAREQCIVTMPNPRQPGDPAAGGQEESYEGAIVLDPTPGFYFDAPVGVADFASLYPSTIISENISYDTLVWTKDYNLDGSFRCYGFGSEACEAAAEPGVRWTDISFDIWGSDPEDKRKHPAKIRTGTRICRYAQYAGNAKGALPEIVQKLLAARKAKRKEADKETDPFRKALLDAEQLAYKLTANSLYGQLGSATFKIRLQHLAASVTAYGRKQIMFAKAAIERFYGPVAARPDCCAETVYGDTDSLFINFNVRNPETGERLTGRAAIEATMHLTEEAGKFVSKMLAAPHDFEYDKVFYPFIIFSKKRYVGNKYEESSENYTQTSMGIATKRRDYAALVKVIYGGALRILLTERNIDTAVTFVKEKLLELVNGKMSLNLLTMSKSLRAEYKSETPPAHKILAQRMAARDPGNAPASGDRIQFIYVLPEVGQQAAKLQGDRIETPAYIRAKGLPPDARFYIEHQLMNPLVQLFSLVADKVPGAVPPKGGWATATQVEREAAVEHALFDESFAICDRLAKRRFGAKMFGTSAPAPAVVPTARVTRSSTAAAAAAASASASAKPAKTQRTLDSLFVTKMILKGMERPKSQSPTNESTKK